MESTKFQWRRKQIALAGHSATFYVEAVPVCGRSPAQVDIKAALEIVLADRVAGEVAAEEAGVAVRRNERDYGAVRKARRGSYRREKVILSVKVNERGTRHAAPLRTRLEHALIEMTRVS